MHTGNGLIGVFIACSTAEQEGFQAVVQQAGGIPAHAVECQGNTCGQAGAGHDGAVQGTDLDQVVGADAEVALDIEETASDLGPDLVEHLVGRDQGIGRDADKGRL